MTNLDGKIVASQEASLSVSNRGYAYGDAVFETLRVINGKIMFWEDHYFRLMASMRIMRMEIPSTFSPEFLEQEIKDLLETNEQLSSAARVRFSVHRKEGGFYRPNTNDVGYVITSEVLEDPFYIMKEDFYEVELFKDHYINSGLLSTVKTNNRAINVLGSIFAKENEYDNCLLLNENKSVVEALNGNLFLVTGKTIKTPPVNDGCIKGIVRGKIIEILKKLPEYTVVEESVSAFELQKADEMFITNVVMGIRPVSKYRKKEFKMEVAKELLTKLNVQARLS
ncbi:branched-chain amino acid aminotransferase [Salinimicrobium catena]|uniref:branched-chain-amino-acid transaminase n=1 Tax=Salinimicrobium catena TaxID=390640 RepID=A0A1H5P7W8_9FLAO|nr:aminotransferase class IV [Salinimicrobium catena]SDL75309.1 branched-chain amino acid aminotransferase [Salinimicrobium catena]SEF09989.1 branched-chain amino acid aminotransferase [Salinimicrobium catena]